jgi:tetratricopeptide (TPR) repeat protein
MANVEALALKTKGNAMFTKQRYPEALEFYRRALRGLGPQDHDVRASVQSNAAQVHIARGDWAAALAAAEAALRAAPAHTKSHYRRAVALQCMGERRRSIDACLEGLAHDPGSDELLGIMLEVESAQGIAPRTAMDMMDDCD